MNQQSRILLLALCVAVRSPGDSGPAVEAEKPETADAEWAVVEAAMDDHGIAVAGQPAERWRRQLRAAGTRFWEKYPADSRRYRWLWATVRTPPGYWCGDQGMTQVGLAEAATPGVDVDALESWHRTYLAMRTAYLGDPSVRGDEKRQFRDLECVARASSLRDELARPGGDLVARLRGKSNDYWRLATDVMDSGESLGYVSLAATELVRIASHDRPREKALLAAMRASSSGELRALGSSRAELLHRLGDRPVDLTLPRTDGGEVSLAALRGKVVLLEFWNVMCHQCIESMPRLQEVYRRYHPLGFEIVHVNVVWDPANKAAERAKAQEILAKQGVTFPNCILDPWAGGHTLEDDPILRQYDLWGAGGGFSFLLNQEGKLVTTDIRDGWLEFEVRRLLGVSPERP